MRVKKNGEIYQVRLEIGEEFVDSVSRLAAVEGIESGAVQAIGALRDFELGYYWLNRKEYKREKFSEIVELLSCQGNIVRKEGKHFSHLHVCLGREDYSVIGGHLFSGIVAVTAEVFLRPLPESVTRVPDEVTGLALLDLPFRKAF